MDIDSVAVNFSPTALMALNGVFAVVMLSIALDLTIGQFRALAAMPRAVIAGVLAQFVALPAVTFGLVVLSAPPPSVALGLMLVAACPGGNISNFLTHRAGGNAALSVSLTALATVLGIIATPFNLALWAGLYPPARDLLRATAIDPADVALTIVVALVLPLVLGLSLRHARPEMAMRWGRVLRPVAMAIFVGFVAVSLAGNWRLLGDLAVTIPFLVIVHNALAFLLGYGVGRAFRLRPGECRTIAIETGIQNSGLGLILIFGFFGGMGGMAVVAALWGLWHAVAGLGLAWFWARRPVT